MAGRLTTRPAALHAALVALCLAAGVAAAALLAAGHERAAFHALLWPCVAAYVSRATR